MVPGIIGLPTLDNGWVLLGLSVTVVVFFILGSGRSTGAW